MLRRFCFHGHFIKKKLTHPKFLTHEYPKFLNSSYTKKTHILYRQYRFGTKWIRSINALRLLAGDSYILEVLIFALSHKSHSNQNLVLQFHHSNLHIFHWGCSCACTNDVLRLFADTFGCCSFRHSRSVYS